MGAAISHSVRQSRCAPVVFEHKDQHVSTRLLQLTADLRPCSGAFRQASQMQQCARLLTSCCQGLPDLRQYRLASMHMNPCLQQWSTLCTGGLSYILIMCYNLSSWMEIKVGPCCFAGSASDISNSNDIVHKEQPEEVGPNISLLAKELQTQWHVKRNMHLGNNVIRPHSLHKVWWLCEQCPEGLPHVWESRVHNRSQGTGCLFCSGTAVCQHNTLARKAPEVARFWDAKKNHPMSPDQVTVYSSMRAYWKCGACWHEWQAPIKNKGYSKTGCPKCAKANGGRKADGTRQKHPTFARIDHALLEQWDHVRNSEHDNFPDNTTLQSRKLIWWCCHECPQGKVHSWQASPNNRIGNRACVQGCPCCVGQKLCECNSLETVCPEIAADFDAQKNGISPAQITSSASTEYSWLSDEPGAKLRSVAQRTAYRKRLNKVVQHT